MFEAIFGVMRLAAVVIGVTVIAPAAVMSGHGTEAGIAAMLIWLVIRIVFGKDDADDYLEEVEKNKK